MFSIFKINLNIVSVKLIVCAAISTLLVMPLFYIAATSISHISFYDIAIKTAVFSAIIWISQQFLSLIAFKRLKFSAALGSLFFTILFITAWIEAGLIHFTGESFSPQFFYHLNWQSSIIAFHTYTKFLISLLISIFISVFLLIKYLQFKNRIDRLQYLKQPSDKPIIPIQTNLNKSKIFVYLIIALLALPNTPIWGLGKQAWRYYFTEPIDIRITDNDREVLSDIGTRLISEGKSDIKASLPQSPENLIMIFLESMDFQFVNNPDFINLTPSLNRYSERFTLLKNHISTENATMPAIISNLCGIVPDYSMGNDTLSNEEFIYKNLACFTDILRSAGYYQVYMGGADSSFAGKRDFLRQHGYHEIFGWEYWANNETYKDDENHSYWGLYDSDLFEEAILKMEKLKSLSPFNLTLLTLNTHLPGFFSNSCSGYVEDTADSTNRDMLNAIHCSDKALGRYLDWLDKNGFFENTTIVIAGDHKMFTHEITHAILGDKIEDQRIFGMLYSPNNNLPKVIDERTAPYDMASTIPELLGIEHNVQFSIGQSILEPVAANRFILDRDMRNGAENCDAENITLPINTTSFSPCEYKRILAILDQNLLHFNQPESTLIQKLDHIVMRSTITYQELPSIFLDEVEQLEHISKDGVVRDRKNNGIYCVKLSSEGKIRLRAFYDILTPADMEDLLRLLENMTQGEWLFMVHKGDIMKNLPSSILYLLQQMGWKTSRNSLSGHSSIFAARKGCDPNGAIFNLSRSDENIETELMFSDFKELLAIANNDQNQNKDQLLNNSKFISAVINDGGAIQRNIGAGINICGFGGGASLFSFFYEPVELKRGLNLLIFSNLWELTANLNYDFYESDIKNSDELVQALLSDTAKFDMTVAVAIHDDAKANLPESVINALKRRGAEKIDNLKFRSPYLFVFHTKYGAIYEDTGKSGACIAADRGKIIKKVLYFTEKTKIMINEAEKQNNDK